MMNDDDGEKEISEGLSRIRFRHRQDVYVEEARAGAFIITLL
jgi:hypothetical protein